MKNIIIDSSYFRIRKRYKWKTAYQTYVFVDEMSETHLKNCFRRVTQGDFPQYWEGINKHLWRDIFLVELSKRRLL